MNFLKPVSIVRGDRLSPVITTVTAKQFLNGVNANGNPTAYGITLGSTFIGVLKYRFTVSKKIHKPRRLRWAIRH